MQYSPLNAVPYVSRVDAGTVELVRGFGVEIVSAADLIQMFEACWTDRQLGSHQYAAAALRRIVDEAFSHVRESVMRRRQLTEYELQQFILSRIHEAGMTTSSAPIAAVNEHSADPHYGPSPKGSAQIGRDDLVLIDLWANRRKPGSVYADITWTGYVGSAVPDKHRAVFNVVRKGRDAALEFVRRRCKPASVRSGASGCGVPRSDPVGRLRRPISSSHRTFDRRGSSWQRCQHRWA